MHQIGAQQHQQRQCHQPQAQAADLHHHKARPRTQLPHGQTHALWQALRPRHAHQPLQQPHGQPAQQHKQQYGYCKAPYGNTAHFQVGTGSEQQYHKPGHPSQNDQRRCGLEPPQLAPDHAQRRRIGHLQHRRQAKGQQQGHAHAQPDKRRLHAGLWQIAHAQHIGQQGHKAVMHTIPQGHATQATRQPGQ